MSVDHKYAPGYTPHVVHSVADEIKRQQRERFSRMSPAERFGLSIRLGDEGLEEFMRANRLDRAEAVKAIRRSRRAGRRRSRCSDEDR